MFARTLIGVRRGLLVLAIVACAAGTLAAAKPGSAETDALQATASPAARKSAIQSIPYDKLDADARAKVDAVLSNVTVFRRLPVRVVNCDPDLYLFLVRHPDVIVNIWEVLGVAQLQLRQTGVDSYRVVESEGTAASLEFLYHNNDTHLVYGEWTYTGPLLAHKVSGRCLAILKSGYVRENDGRYYITSRLDGFMSVEAGAAEVLTRTLHPLVVKNVDTNFIQTVAFVGSLSKTAEVNLPGVQRLASRLTHVQPLLCQQFSQVAAGVATRAAAAQPAQVAVRPQTDEQR